MKKKKNKKERGLRISDCEKTVIIRPQAFIDYMTDVLLIPYEIAFRVTKIAKGKSKR